MGEPEINERRPIAERTGEAVERSAAGDQRPPVDGGPFQVDLVDRPGQGPRGYEGPQRVRYDRAWFRQHGPAVVTAVGLAVLITILGVRKHQLTEPEGLFFAVLVPSVILHEISHGLIAYWCGDDTAKRAGRLSLNPIRHVSMMGTVIVPALLIYTTGAAFGWAKPVPVRLDKLRHPRNQAVLVGLVGPFTNFLIAALSALVFRYVLWSAVSPGATFGDLGLVAQLVVMLGFANVIVGVFNLIPVPPLDGSAIVERLLPLRLLGGYYRIRMGFLLVVFFVLWVYNPLSGVFSWCERVWLHVAT